MMNRCSTTHRCFVAVLPLLPPHAHDSCIIPTPTIVQSSAFTPLCLWKRHHGREGAFWHGNEQRTRQVMGRWKLAVNRIARDSCIGLCTDMLTLKIPPHIHPG
ncbi:unnamed protein product [Periconia digitata]|uniref:Uncharacterized protein n=1 Tax=Periconia digitata TaxID=1303443 RepID=A0A9W4UND1_9PLEO|nr:unnamed protein product [Periconia digitata]